MRFLVSHSRLKHLHPVSEAIAKMLPWPWPYPFPIQQAYMSMQAPLQQQQAATGAQPVPASGQQPVEASVAPAVTSSQQQAFGVYNAAAWGESPYDAAPNENSGPSVPTASQLPPAQQETAPVATQGAAYAPMVDAVGAMGIGSAGSAMGAQQSTGYLQEEPEILRCHLHTKPQLSCKFCRKYKTAVHQLGRVQRQQEAQSDSLEKPNMVEMTNPTTFNLNTLLRENILSSEYYKSLFALKQFHEVVDEIYQYADHADPYCAGNSRAPSTLFCCLYKFFTMRLTEKQVKSLLDHQDSPYIRACGFLYLRYILDPQKLWKWYEPYFLDDEEFAPGTDKNKKMEMGQFVESLITEDKYGSHSSTVLPRLPVKIKTQYGAQLIAMDEHRKRKKSNKQRIEEFVPGTKVDACSNGDWLEGAVVRVIDKNAGRLSCLVALEDGSEETIDLGLVILRTDEEEDALGDNGPADAEIDESAPREDDGRRNDERGNLKDRKYDVRYSRSRSASKSEDRQDRRKQESDHHEKRKERDGERRRREDASRRRRSPSEEFDDGRGRHVERDRRRRDHHARSRSGSGEPEYRRVKRERSRSRDRDRGSKRDWRDWDEKDRERSDRDRPKTNEELMEEFRKRERNKALASGKDYARRPTSYKSALSAKILQSTRKKSRSPSPNRQPRDEDKRRSPSPEQEDRKEPSLEHKQKMAQLMEK
mmetsp:Transcript_13741/g.39594  ORF Transcript_13741/g.39594 Transcript_13741/m.39594 type:complete len:704 (+) Transcript_13741:69-2180(+)